jgi:23S rRNA (adenine1618-N6)-methyltransferase
VIRRSIKEQLHPRNRFRDRVHDYPALVASRPALAAFVAPSAYGDLSIDYANPDAVMALNQALLTHAYGLDTWDLPPGSLCPPIPGRSDYLHYLADLLRSRPDDPIPRGASIAVLDIGQGPAASIRSLARSNTAGALWARRLIRWRTSGPGSRRLPTGPCPV